jgi:hypothetical protein
VQTDSTAVPTEKVRRIQSAFGPAIGATLISYTTAELLFDDGTWGAWADLPIRLEWGPGRVIAASWSKFDDLWIADGLSLPFELGGQKVRWVSESLEKLNGAIGATIEGAMLGRGEMTVGGRDMEIWSRLLIRTDRGWIEIYNALDENGYDYHAKRPRGDFISCI